MAPHEHLQHPPDLRVVGAHRDVVSQDLPRVEVDHGRQVELPELGYELGDVGPHLLVRPGRGEVAVEDVRGRLADLAPVRMVGPPLGKGRKAGLPHDPLHALDVDPEAAPPQLGRYPRGPVFAQVRPEYGLDLAGQGRVLPLPVARVGQGVKIRRLAESGDPEKHRKAMLPPELRDGPHFRLGRPLPF